MFLIEKSYFSELGSVGSGLTGSFILKLKGELGRSTVSIPTSSLSPSFFRSVGSTVSSLLRGLQSGWFAKVELRGVGFKLFLLNHSLLLDLGYNGFLLYTLPRSLLVTGKKSSLLLFSTSKPLLTLTVSQLLSLRKPDPYKGKGVVSDRSPRLKRRKKDGK